MAPLASRLVFLVTFAGLVLYLLSNINYSQRWDARSSPQTASSKRLHSFRWTDVKTRYPVKRMMAIPTGRHPNILSIQSDHSAAYESSKEVRERQRRTDAVKKAFLHSWKGYRKNAWLADEVRPLSGGAYNPFGGWGATLVDSLDTLWLMNLTQEFEEVTATLEGIDFTNCAIGQLNVFETTIRYLGGFLSAYDLTEGKYEVLLRKARELGDMLMVAFDTPNRMPITRNWDWRRAQQGYPQIAPAMALLAELGSLTLEFTRLSQLTLDPKYFDAVQRISDLMYEKQNQTKIPGLWPVSVYLAAESFNADSVFTLGGMADSAYEYLPKMYLLLHGRIDEYRSMYQTALGTAKKYLVFEPLLPPATRRDSLTPSLLGIDDTPLLLGTARASGPDNYVRIEPEGQHLACFAGGMIALGTRAMQRHQTAEENAADLLMAARLTEGCMWSYRATVTGIGPEVFHTKTCRRGQAALSHGQRGDWVGERGNCEWNRDDWISAVRRQQKGIGDQVQTLLQPENAPEQYEEFIRMKRLTEGFTEVTDPRYMLRPEAVESLFVLWRITGDSKYREQAWAMFESIVPLTRTDIAFAGIVDVTMRADPAKGEKIMHIDRMESYWTSETLKYFYLIFAQTDLVSLDEFVFNTEAHPLRWQARSVT